MRIIPTLTAPEPAPVQARDGALLSAINVTRRYRSKRHDTLALDRVSLDVREGEFVCLVGPSGCGKSTLLNLVAGFEQPDGGTIAFDGHAVTSPGPERTVVFQEAALFPWLNVRSNIEFGMKLQGIPRAERKERAHEFIQMVNLDRFERAFVHELSGGMKQRAQLARALAVHPRMLLMDEPFAALDAQTRDVLQVELQQLCARIGATVLFVTHNVREAALLGDRVVVMTPGPGRILTELHVDIERPRMPDDHRITDLAAEIRRHLGTPAEAGELAEVAR